jgi:hypothetical protein
MKRFLLASFWLGFTGTGLFAASCGGDDSSGAPDAASDTTAPESATPDTPVPPSPDATKAACNLGNGDDPVALCTQKLVLGAIHDAALKLPAGVAPSWDRTTGTPDPDAHDLRDDAAYAAACTNYAQSATRYGDTEISSTLLADFAAITPILKNELGTIPDEYSGQLYTRVRDVAIGARYVLDNAGGTAFDAIGDQIGAKIFGHFIALAGPDGGVVDAGDAGDAGAEADAGFTLPGDGVLASDATNRDYAPEDVATGALALVDMAVRHPSDPSAGAWALAAVESFEHLHTRARSPSGAYYRLLMPSGAPDHDDLSPRAPAPQDLLATETTAAVAYALFRASDLVTNNATLAPIIPIAGYDFIARANAALASLHGTPSFYDADKGGYFEGVLAGSGAVLPNKPTRANALMLGALHRATALRVSPYTKQAKTTRTVVGATSPIGAGLLATSLEQKAYFELVAKDFSGPPSDLDGSVDPHPNSYVSAASLLAVDALNDGWFGYP